MTPRENALQQVLDVLKVEREEAQLCLDAALTEPSRDHARGRLVALRAVTEKIRRLRREQP